MLETLSPLSGRIVIRRLPDLSGSMLGVLRFAPHEKLTESAGYLLWLTEHSVALCRTPYDQGPPESVDGYGINAALHEPQWPCFLEAPELMLIRPVAAFPHQNVWTIYGAARRLSLPAGVDDRADVWFDLDCRAKPCEISAPAESRGVSCAQLLTELCVWPDAYGTPHCVPQHPSAWRLTYLQMGELTAQVGAGSLSEVEFYRRVQADPRLRKAAPLRVDMAFACYLSRLQAEGSLKVSAPATAQERAERDAQATRILRDLALS